MILVPTESSYFTQKNSLFKNYVVEIFFSCLFITHRVRTKKNSCTKFEKFQQQKKQIIDWKKFLGLSGFSKLGIPNVEQRINLMNYISDKSQSTKLLFLQKTVWKHQELCSPRGRQVLDWLFLKTAKNKQVFFWLKTF